MRMDEEKLAAAIAAFRIDRDELAATAAAFRYDIERGLEGNTESTLPLLPAYIGLPTGEEKGEYLALDFGGTNVRALRLRLLGNGRHELLGKAAAPLRQAGKHDYVSARATATELFDFIAGLIETVLDGDTATEYRLGHTFSFPSAQTDLYNARLLRWTKEFATRGVEGEVVNDLLTAALERRGLKNVHPAAVINDTVAVLLAAAYEEHGTYIGSIYATGQNNCYLETYGGTQPAMILNMESGNFGKLLPNAYDRTLDDASEKPGQQRLEKMVSGRYMGELFSLVLADVLGAVPKHRFTSVDMAAMLGKPEDGVAVLASGLGQECSLRLMADLQPLLAAIVRRSARLTAAGYAGILWHRAGHEAIAPQQIAIDGSVYEKMPIVQENMARAMSELLGGDAARVQLRLANGGSGLGAAIAAAMSKM